MAASQRSERDRIGGFVFVAAVAALMWIVETIDLVAGDLDGVGIRPRDPEGRRRSCTAASGT